ncbi:hypothetical protein EDB83DRAFT_2530416 [Lactarius deliciosus]|nr:hypothetical protein EDB83DRAFT_2530416 [Lactarius deliciosus]
MVLDTPTMMWDTLIMMWDIPIMMTSPQMVSDTPTIIWDTLTVTFVPEMPEEFLEEDDVRAFGSMTQEHYDAWRHIEASFLST